MSADAAPLRAKHCKGHVKRDGGRPCKRLAILGGDVCPMHGGRAPQVKQAAAKRVALAQAVAAADVRSPDAILMHTLHVSDVLLHQALNAAGAEMTPEQLATVVQHLERAQGFARATLSAGVEERAVRVAENVSRAVADVLEAVLEQLQLTDAQEATARRVVPAQLGRLRAVLG